MNARLQTEIKIIPHEGKYIVYAPLRKTAFISNAGLVNQLVDFSEENALPSEASKNLYKYLEHLDLLGPDDNGSLLNQYTGTPEPTHATLFLTTTCNLRCSYCYASAGDTPIENMKLDVAKYAIDYIVSNALKTKKNQISLGYHGGGEPTVNWKVLTGSLEYARKQARDNNLKLQATTATNGVLNDKQISWVLKNLNGASVSFDGLPEIQDLHRPTKLGKPSSEKVIHTLKQLSAARFNFGIRVTVTADQIGNLPDAVEYLCKNFSPNNIQAEPSYAMGRWKNGVSAETEKFVDGYKDAESIARLYGKVLSFSGARIGHLTNHFCGVSQDNFSVSPKGNVSACYEVFSENDPNKSEFFYARPDGSGNYKFDIKVLTKLRNQSVNNKTHCDDCFARWTCGGDCYNKALHMNGPEVESETDRCDVIRELTKHQLLQKIAGSDELYWRG